MSEEGVPFGVRGGSVFLTGAGRPAAGDEPAVGFDRFGWVDRFVAHGRVYVLVPTNDLGDVRWQTIHDGIGHKDSTKIVRGKGERLAVGVGETGYGERVDEQFADRGGGERPVLLADAALEQ